jgi:hypothetical protein
MAFDIKAWSDYGIAIVCGAAALVGLLFVAVSVNSAWFSSSTAHRGRAGQALVLFVVPLVTGIPMPIPDRAPRRLVSRVGAFGLLVGRAFLMLGSAELNDEPRAIGLIDRTSPRRLAHRAASRHAPGCVPRSLPKSSETTRCKGSQALGRCRFHRESRKPGRVWEQEVGGSNLPAPIAARVDMGVCVRVCASCRSRPALPVHPTTRLPSRSTVVAVAAGRRTGLRGPRRPGRRQADEKLARAAADRRERG